MSGSASADRIRVVVSDDHPVVRQACARSWRPRASQWWARPPTAPPPCASWPRPGPDVLLTDLVMPGMDGIEAIRRVRGLGIPVGILVLTSFSGAEQVIPAIRAGADGYLLKDAGPAALTDAIRAVHRGEALLSPEAAAVVMARVAGDDGNGACRARHRLPPHPDLDRLTPRERDQVLAGLRGLSNRQLAAELFVSEKTVKTHVSSLLAKLRLRRPHPGRYFFVRAGGVDLGSDGLLACWRWRPRLAAATAVYLLAVRTTSGQTVENLAMDGRPVDRCGCTAPRPRASRWWPPCWRWAGRWPWWRGRPGAGHGAGPWRWPPPSPPRWLRPRCSSTWWWTARRWWLLGDRAYLRPNTFPSGHSAVAVAVAVAAVALAPRPPRGGRAGGREPTRPRWAWPRWRPRSTGRPTSPAPRW